MLFIIFLIVTVSDYNKQLDEQYTFASDTAKREYLETVIVDTTDSPEAVNKAINELLKMPDRVWTQFYRNGGKVIITYDLPRTKDGEEAVGTFGMPCVGFYKIYVSPEYIEYALLHEFGHYMGYAKNIERDSRFYDCLPEKAKALNGVLNENIYFEQSSEYFAEMTKLYFHNELSSSEYPLFTAYIESVLSEF